MLPVLLYIYSAHAKRQGSEREKERRSGNRGGRNIVLAAKIKEAERAGMSSEEFEKTTLRNRIIVRTSIIGILANVMLAAFKAVIGVMTGSIAITMDAVNNISDAASSLITIIGTKLATKPADRKHPFGYGRIEYLSAMIISIIVFYAGITSFAESVKKIVHPETPEYSMTSLVIVAIGVLVKIVLGHFVKKTGQKVNSDSLVNSGEDAKLDSVISASTLAAAVVFMIFHVSLESWLGAIISIVIIKSGLEMLRNTVSEILGERGDAELAKGVKETVSSFPEVRGAYDLVLNNYGPNAYSGSLHIEVPDTMTADKLDVLTRQITAEVSMKNHVYLTAIGVYSYNTKDLEAATMRDRIRKKVMEHENVMQMHAFYADRERKVIRFDMIVSFDAKDRTALYHEVTEEIQEMYPEYTVITALDTDFSES
ncbi:cation diffusion facilitator family transporter [Pyramidobacter sp. C12-8]|uniref:cation diffusion facilitator family transporter n=1 Tax=Pyramidobacter sp. C12-8 TaxID=1943580 RepID=UPI001981CDF3|nr:cation diffusion facilitator family transporter [Pyramidobacter sp. C12-8]